MMSDLDRDAIKAEAARKRIAERIQLDVGTIGETRLWRAVEPEVATFIAALEDAGWEKAGLVDALFKAKERAETAERKRERLQFALDKDVAELAGASAHAASAVGSTTLAIADALMKLGYQGIRARAESAESRIAAVREWRDEHQAHEVYEATENEPEECTDECEWCLLDAALHPVAETDEGEGNHE